MTAKQILSALERYAPLAVSREYCETYGAYDNSGLIIDTGEEIDRAIFSLDFSMGAVKKAIETGAKLIVTHHPAIYAKIGRILVDESDGKKYLLCIRNGISVLSMHLNLDCAVGGIDDALAEALGAAGEVKIMEKLSFGGYGKCYAVKEPLPLKEYAAGVKETLRSDRVLCYGKREVDRVASFCGAGASESAVLWARAQGADTVVSADWKHHLITLCLENDMNVVDLTHYASENYGFHQFYKKCQSAIEVPCIFYGDEIG
ncbi:MAG: Nif3-like dinuclear metal center hexameric protein [Christensenellaceae bacterium]